MGNFLKEFKNFASGGNMFDLALGVIIGAGFTTVVESLSKDIIGDFIAAVGGQPDLSGWTIKFREGEIHIGNFIGALINFLILAVVLFMVVKVIMYFKLANFRAQGSRECPYCREFIAVDAIKCKHCTADVKALIDGDEGADER
ncbi:MAG: Large-conductance mechanosensitive channel [Bacteroidota bacterium]|jgi:large conductance mechanosensitive channel